jgi:hypothetical protein
VRARGGAGTRRRRRADEPARGRATYRTRRRLACGGGERARLRVGSARTGTSERSWRSGGRSGDDRRAALSAEAARRAACLGRSGTRYRATRAGARALPASQRAVRDSCERASGGGVRGCGGGGGGRVGNAHPSDRELSDVYDFTREIVRSTLLSRVFFPTPTTAGPGEGEPRAARPPPRRERASERSRTFRRV